MRVLVEESSGLLLATLSGGLELDRNLGNAMVFGLSQRQLRVVSVLVC